MNLQFSLTPICASSIKFLAESCLIRTGFCLKDRLSIMDSQLRKGFAEFGVHCAGYYVLLIQNRVMSSKKVATKDSIRVCIMSTLLALLLSLILNLNSNRFM